MLRSVAPLALAALLGTTCLAAIALPGARASRRSSCPRSSTSPRRPARPSRRTPPASSTAPPSASSSSPMRAPASILEATPGLIVTQHSGEGKANQYFLRGFNLDHGTDLAITVDGMPVNMRTHGHGQGYADVSFLIPELIPSMRIRKGPYFADEGDFSSAGALHIDYIDTLNPGLLQGTFGMFDYGRGLAIKSVPRGPATCWSPAKASSTTARGSSPTACASSTASSATARAPRSKASPSPAWPTTTAGPRPTRSPSAPSTRASSTASARSTRPTAAARAATACRRA